MDAITLLERDHREVEQLFETFAATEVEEERRSTAETIIKELSIHSEIEKLHLYPALRERVPGGEGLADHSLEEHQQVEELLAKAEGELDKAGNKGFFDLMERVRRNVDEHVDEEETEIFPKLQEACTKAQLNELGKAMAKAKTKAPTHPHPSAPNEGPAHQVMGRAAGMVDRARDTVTGR
jgi:hemerythrin superfamily protein